MPLARCPLAPLRGWSFCCNILQHFQFFRNILWFQSCYSASLNTWTFIPIMSYPHFNHIQEMIQNITWLLISLCDSNIIQVPDRLCGTAFDASILKSLFHFWSHTEAFNQQQHFWGVVPVVCPVFFEWGGPTRALLCRGGMKYIPLIHLYFSYVLWLLTLQYLTVSYIPMLK